MAWTRKKALKDVTILTFSQYTVQALLVLRGFLYGKFLGPEGFGVWASIYLFYTYGQYCHMGIFNSVIIMAPERIGAGKVEEATKLLSSAITWMNIFGRLFFLSITAYVLITNSPFISSMWLPIILVSLSVPVYLNFNFSIYRLQFKHDFRRSGAYQAALAILDLGLSFVLLMNFGILGAFIGMVLSQLLITSLIVREGYKDLFVSFEKKSFYILFKYGVKLLFIVFGFSMLTTLDKFSVANFFSKTDMGIFSMAASIAMVPLTLGTAVQGLNTQRMLEEYGKTKEIISLKIFLEESTLAIAFLIPLFSILLITFIEPLVEILLPKYIESLQYANYLSMGIYFLAISLNCLSFLVIVKKYNAIILLTTGLIISFFVANWFLFRSGFGLTGLSYMTIINYFFFTAVIYFLSFLNFYNIKAALIKFIGLLFPVLLIYFCFVIDSFISSAIFRFIIKLNIALLWGIFAFFYLRSKTTILAQLIIIIRNKLVFFSK